MKKTVIIIATIIIIAGVAAYFLFFAKPEPETVYYTPGDYFVTNIKDSTALIKATIVLELYTEQPEEATAYLTENNHVIRDIIVFTLRSKTEEELRSQGIEDALRTEIVNNLKSKMGLDYIKTIYFNDYVIQ